jgi:hypothetical protein
LLHSALAKRALRCAVVRFLAAAAAAAAVAELAAVGSQGVASLDLVATAPGVIACNMAATPLGSASQDAAVFSLALMGTDYGGFLVEAARVLRPKGWLWLAEVRLPRRLGGAWLRALSAGGIVEAAEAPNWPASA